MSLILSSKIRQENIDSLEQVHNAACDSTKIQDIRLLAHNDPSYCLPERIITKCQQQY